MNTELQGAQTGTSMPTFVLKGAAGILVATVVNAALFVVTSPLAFPLNAIAEETGAPVGLADVTIATLVGGIFVVGGYALLRRFLPSLNRARRLYLLAVLVLLLMAYGPFTIHNVGIRQIVVMELMHVITGMVPLYSIIRSQRL
jgi:hypothetical protein